jgi:hypothetical protein
MNATSHAHRWRLDQRAGVLLDLVIGTALVILAAFALYALGLNFGEILNGAGHFFGI